jgi:hypothetical protein
MINLNIMTEREAKASLFVISRLDRLFPKAHKFLPDVY